MDLNLIFGLPAYHLGVVYLVLTIILWVGFLVYRLMNPERRIKGIIVVLLLSLLPVMSTFRKGDYNGGLYQDAAFAAGFYDSLSEGNLIPRWAERLDTHFGYPAYIFLYPLPFYLSTLFHVAGFSFVYSVKLVFALAYIASGVSMWLFARNRFSRTGALLATVLYQFAPYRFIDMYFRLDVGEAVAFIFIPLVLLWVDLFIKKPKIGHLAVGAIASAALILSHPALSLAGIGLAGLYAVIRKKRKGLIPLAVGLLLSAYYWFPVLAEANWVHMKAYTNGKRISGVSFVKVSELLYAPYRWGLLFQGNQAHIAYIIGYAAVAVIAGAIGIVLFQLRRRRPVARELVIWLGVFGILVFMLTEYSALIWKVTPLLKNFQFSWRLLGIIAPVVALIGGLLVDSIKAERRGWLIAVAIICFAIFTTILNWGNRESSPDSMSDTTIRTLMPTYNRIVQTGFPQAVPTWVDLNNEWGSPQISGPIEVVSGSANIHQTFRSSTRHAYQVEATQETLVKENTYYYPGWVLNVNNQPAPISYQNPDYPGVMEFTLPPGTHTVDLRFTSTPDRTGSLWVSGLTGLCLLIGLIRDRFIQRQIAAERA